MFDFITYGTEELQAFLLALLRISGLFITAPIFRHVAVPIPAKTGLVVLLAGIMTLTIDVSSLAPVESIWHLAGLASREVLVGAVIGLLFNLLIMGVQTAGGLIGYQMGFAIVSVVDPNSSGQIPILGQFWTLVTLIVFLTINGHHLVITALADSYRAIPVGGLSLTSSAWDMIIKYTAYVFIIALKISAPVVITLFMIDVALGAIAKTMPTMNVFFVGIPVKIAAGLGVMALSLPIVAYVLEKGAGYLDNQLRTLMLTMGKA